MNGFIGQILVILSIFCNIISLTYSIIYYLTFSNISTKIKLLNKQLITSKNVISITEKIYYIGAISCFMALVTLAYSFVISDFSLETVFFNSSTLKPFILKLGATWATNEGSLLLWASIITTICAISYYQLTKIKKLKYENCKEHKTTQNHNDLYRFIASSIQISFLILVYYAANPFIPLTIDTANQGLGLNPLLQDVALAIHPPILYLGNALTIVPFITAILIIYEYRYLTNLIDEYKNKKDITIEIIKTFQQRQKTLIIYLLSYLRISIIFLIMGISLGAWWAYRELGWGGYWFFDAVENISLMPLISNIILYHLILVTKKAKYTLKYDRQIILLALSSFILVIYGTACVRSGIISSVHSFAFAPKRGIILFIISTIIMVSAVIFYLYNNSAINSNTIKNLIRLPDKKHGNNNLAKLTYYGNNIMLLYLFILVISIIYPIYYFINYDTEIIIDPEFFYKIFVPITPIITLFMILPCLDYLRYDKNSKNFIYKTCLIFFTSILITSKILYLYQDYLSNFENYYKITLGLIITSSIYLMLNMLYGFIFEIFVIKITTKSILYSRFQSILGHFGFALLTLAISINILTVSKIEFIGNKGHIVKQNNVEVKLHDIKFAEISNYFSQIAEFWIKDQNDKIHIIQPENRLYKLENTISQEADIITFLTHDIYGVISKISNDTIYAIIYIQPMIGIIWLSFALIIIAFAMRIFYPK